MNIGKSTKVALVKKEKRAKWLSEQMGVSVQMIRNILSSKSANTKQVQKLADVFEMKPSEFIALGE